jgi:glycosyltransferase involved in cell wall biosynthesis
VRILEVTDNNHMLRLYADATLMLVPLKPNKHASGITVIQEAALRELPIIATDTGGLHAYFDEGSLYYIPPSDPGAILPEVRQLSGNRQRMLQLARNAQDRMGPAGLGAETYVARHVKPSEQLLKPDAGRRHFDLPRARKSKAA